MSLRFADFVFDPEGRQLRRGEEEIRLSPRTFRLLEILIEERPRAVPKLELMNLIWPDAVVEESNLKTTVSELRAALDDADRPRLIRTVQRYGYAFSGEVATDTPASDPKGASEASHTPSIQRIHISARRNLPWFAAVALLLVVAGAGWFAVRGRRPRIDPPQAISYSAGTPIVIFPFTIRGRADLAYLGEGMIDLLGRKLDGVGDLRTIEAKIILDHLKHEEMTSVDRETGRAIAARFGARLFIVGSCVEAGGQL